MGLRDPLVERKDDRVGDGQQALFVAGDWVTSLAFGKTFDVVYSANGEALATAGPLNQSMALVLSLPPSGLPTISVSPLIY